MHERPILAAAPVDRDFDAPFCELTGVRAPFPWQRRLGRFFARGDFDACRTVSLPTGLGKTSIIPIWLLALGANPAQVPRRLVYVVNRRTVVDQASDDVKRVRERLGSESLTVLRERLRGLCGVPTVTPLAVSTLRGQFADNAEWRIDPARPAVIVGTVDMIGSRLLFSGYGTGYRSRSVHAGLLGQDTLIVHDEAHLEPAFQHLLDAIVREQIRAGDLRRLRVIELTATSRTGASHLFALDSDDMKDAAVAKRLAAKKKLAVHGCDDEKAALEAMTRRALVHGGSGAAVLVFTRRVEAADKIATEIRKKGFPVALLTGTMRGFERDRLASADAVFARFLPPSSRGTGVTPVDGTAYLVCTSAGEVGVNISADHLVCDLTPFDSMAQRFGRVNRFGDGDALVDVFYAAAPDPKDPLAEQRAKTLALLERTSSASPEALGRLPEADRLAAFSPPPDVVPVTDILFDAWTLTSIRHDLPGRPPVADWLHGVAEWQPPDTYVAWREEVGVFGANASGDFIEDLLGDYPLKPHEILRDRQHRVFAELEKIAHRRPDDVAWLVNASGEAAVYTLLSLVEKTASNAPVVDISNSQIILSPASGGLTPQGTLDGMSGDANDVADLWLDDSGSQRRARVWDDESLPGLGPWRMLRIIDTFVGEEDDASAEPARRYWKWFVRPRAGDDDGSLASTAAQELSPHLARAAEAGRRLAVALDLPNDIREAIAACLAWHDVGKDRRIWQAAIGNGEYAVGKVLAKSGGQMRPALLNSYRHELGSLLDVARDQRDDLERLTLRDLTLHLIAAHHGRARPHFPAEELFDPGHPSEHIDRVARDVPDRFATLQRRFGRWGLAWLESIVRAADVIASEVEETPE
jgi:CRISPR-associated endonuclease/helicase Cas3